MNPLLVSVNYQYFHRVLAWRGLRTEPVGKLYKTKGFDHHNRLIEINNIFSSCPMGDAVDRTHTIAGPLKFKVLRPWQPATAPQSLDEVFESRVNYYLKQNQGLDLFWSGGADSTALVVAFLKHCTNIDQLRLIYSPYSLYENRDFYNFITNQFPQLETLDISGDVYLNSKFNNIAITGHGGDEFTASLDLSFLEAHGSDVLNRPWKEFFYSQTKDQLLIDFCEQYFSIAGRPIETVLEARWWFYSIAKSQVFAPRDMSFLFDQSSVSLDKFSAFFDCKEFENYMWHNTDKIIDRSGDYKSYKKFLRSYIHKFYHNVDYLENTSKINSMQFQYYRLKKTEMLDLRWICILEDSSVVRTNNLPFFSKKEFYSKYGNNLDYLFNLPC